MAAYYNEIEPYAAEWLRNLIKAGLIADGEVDTRSIVDVQAEDLRGFTQCHFFAGIGGWSYALRLAGWADDRFIWTGSCPCQPFSIAGLQSGSDDGRHLWPVFFRLISECSPSVVVGEQVAGPAGLAWLDHVASDLEDRGYAVAAADIPAGGVGAPHKRHRLWWVGANPNSDGLQGRQRPIEHSKAEFRHEEFTRLAESEIQLSLPTGRFDALANGLPGRVGQTRAYGNAIVPQVAAEFISAFMEAA